MRRAQRVAVRLSAPQLTLGLVMAATVTMLGVAVVWNFFDSMQANAAAIGIVPVAILAAVATLFSPITLAALASYLAHSHVRQGIDRHHLVRERVGWVPLGVWALVGLVAAAMVLLLVLFALDTPLADLSLVGGDKGPYALAALGSAGSVLLALGLLSITRALSLNARKEAGLDTAAPRGFRDLDRWIAIGFGALVLTAAVGVAAPALHLAVDNGHTEGDALGAMAAAMTYLMVIAGALMALCCMTRRPTRLEAVDRPVKAPAPLRTAGVLLGMLHFVIGAWMLASAYDAPTFLHPLLPS